MHVPDRARRSVFFLGNKEKDGSFRPRATAFYVLTSDHDPPRPPYFTYIVTAEHVISGMQEKGWEIFARLNMRDGGATVVSIKEAE